MTLLAQLLQFTYQGSVKSFQAQVPSVPLKKLSISVMLY